jgi:hypothetical protein
MTFGSPENERKLYRKNLVEKSALIWLVLIGAEIIHGILRAIVLVPLVGEFRSNQIGVFTGAAIIVAIVYLTIRWIGAAQRSRTTGGWCELAGCDRGFRGSVRAVCGGIVVGANRFRLRLVERRIDASRPLGSALQPDGRVEAPKGEGK